MIVDGGCRLPLNGHPSYGWWSLDPGMDEFYLWVFLHVGGEVLWPPVATLGVDWVREAVASYVSRFVGPLAYHSPCGYVG